MPSWTPEQLADYKRRRAMRLCDTNPALAPSERHQAAGRAGGKVATATEAQIQAQIVDGLRSHGYLVLDTTHQPRKCAKCGEYGHRGYGTSKGIGDLLVWCEDRWIMADVKRPSGRLTLEQQEHVNRGRMLIWRDIEDALEHLKDHETLVRIRAFST